MVRNRIGGWSPGDTEAANGVLAKNTANVIVTTSAIDMSRGSGITLDATTAASVTGRQR